MAITLKRQLNDGEKEIILNRFGRNCFATGHPIAEGDPLHFDHIRAFVDSKETELNNIAPMCEVHNKQKGRLPLEDFRVKLRLEKFFAQKDALTLRHLLDFLKSEKDINDYGQRVSLKVTDGEITLNTGTNSLTYDLYSCPTTKWKYFYATLPIEILDSDDKDEENIGLQPRYLIQDKVFGLFRHFQNHPVLQPAVGRVSNRKVVLFDGQHKTAALLWNGRREFECKIYLDPDLRVLNQTNISAHDKFSQTRFFSSIMVLKLGDEFGTDFESYKDLEDDSIKSEAGFMRYLERNKEQALTRADLNKRFRSYLYNLVLEDSENKLAKYVSKGNRGTKEQPLTIDMISKSLFANFLYTEPSDDNMATDAYKRDKEIANNVALMNMLHDLAMANWDGAAGQHDENQRRLSRIFGSKPIMAWSELLHDAICAKLEIYDSDEKRRAFYRDLSQADLDKIKSVVERLINWSLWKSPHDSEIDRFLADNKSALKEWFKKKGLTTGYLMGASE
jgi:hypothetical protein